MKELFAFERIDDQATDRVVLAPNELDKVAVRPGDLLFARRSFVLEGAGKCSIIGRTSEPTTFESSMIRARLDRTRAVPRYVFYFFASSLGRNAMASIATQTAVSGITGTSLARLEIPLPPLPTQRKIAAILSAYDDLIENNTRRIKLLEEMVQRIYREWFVDFRYPGHEQVPLVDLALGPIPQGWEVQSFASLAEYVNGFAFKPGDWGPVGLPIVKIRELKNGVTADTPRYAGSLPPKYEIRDGDLLFSWSADLEAYIWSGGPAWLNQHLFRVDSKVDVPIAYLFHGLRERMGEFRARAQGTTMRHIKRAALDQVNTLLPPPALSGRFAETVAPMDQLQLGLTRACRSLRQTRDLLLPRLISGEIDVDQLNIQLPVAA